MNRRIYTHARAYRNASGGFYFSAGVNVKHTQDTARRFSCAVLQRNFSDRLDEDEKNTVSLTDGNCRIDEDEKITMRLTQGETNPTAATSRLDEDERSKLNLGRQGEATIINEPGLYSLVLSSRKPEAKHPLHGSKPDLCGGVVRFSMNFWVFLGFLALVRALNPS